MNRPAEPRAGPAVWPILVFFLVGAAASIFWDLRRPARPPEVTESLPSVSTAGRQSRDAADAPRAAAPRTAAKFSATAPRNATRRAAAPAPSPTSVRARKLDRNFERVGIPVDRRNDAPAAPVSLLREEQADRILRTLIESRGYYGISPECLRARPLGYREGSYGFDVVAANCASIAAGSIIARWRVDAATGEAAYRTPDGTYAPAP